MKHNKPFNENASKKRWHGLAKYARPLTGRYMPKEVMRYVLILLTLLTFNIKAEVYGEITGLTITEHVELASKQAEEYGIKFNFFSRLDSERLHASIPKAILGSDVKSIEVDFYDKQSLIMSINVPKLNKAIKFNKSIFNRFHFKVTCADNKIYHVWISG